MATGVFVLRAVIGLLLIGHGTRKLFGWFGGGGLAATAWFFRSVGYRPPRLVAGLAGGAELAGGVAFTAGAATPVASAIVIAAMLNAGMAVRTRNGLLGVEGGYEYPVVTGFVAATLAMTGAGAASVDAALGLDGGGVESGVLAIALGLVAGLVVLLNRGRSRSRPTASLSPFKKVAG